MASLVPLNRYTLARAILATASICPSAANPAAASFESDASGGRRKAEHAGCNAARIHVGAIVRPARDHADAHGRGRKRHLILHRHESTGRQPGDRNSARVPRASPAACQRRAGGKSKGSELLVSAMTCAWHGPMSCCVAQCSGRLRNCKTCPLERQVMRPTSKGEWQEAVLF